MFKSTNLFFCNFRLAQCKGDAFGYCKLCIPWFGSLLSVSCTFVSALMFVSRAWSTLRPPAVDLIIWLVALCLPTRLWTSSCRQQDTFKTPHCTCMIYTTRLHALLVENDLTKQITKLEKQVTLYHTYTFHLGQDSDCANTVLIMLLVMQLMYILRYRNIFS